MVFLVGFSYAFFWTGYTGLAITIGAIVMLFVIMQATAKVDWNEVFKRRPRGGCTPLPQPTGPGKMPPADEYKPTNLC
jgi:hypothetical protein